MARILVVEDNVQNRKLTTIILQGEGHVVVPAADAVEAEHALGTALPDLLVLDMALPGKDGYALTRELRARPSTARLPILALSAFAMPGDEARARAAGVDDYLTKPIRRALLVERVRSMLEPTTPAGPGPSTAEAGAPAATQDGP